MNIPQQLDELTKKIDELQKQINYQNECIMDQSMIIHKLIEKLVWTGHSPYLDERFTGPIQHDKWKPYKGPDCADGFVNTSTEGTEIRYERTNTNLYS